MQVADFGQAQRGWWEQMPDRGHGIPFYDTFGRVCARLDAQAMENGCLQWVQELHELTRGQFIAMDCHSVCRFLGDLWAQPR